MNKIVTFFGSATLTENTDEYKETYLIGKFLAEKNYIIKNGGYNGLMEGISKGSIENNGKTLGITCKSFGHFKGNNYLTDIINAEDIFERLKILINESDIFIVNVGGIGTLSELFLTIDIFRKIEKKPNIYLIGEKWYKIFTLLNDEKFIRNIEMDMITFCFNYNNFVNNFNKKEK
jgi:hypothetical protein